MFCKLFVCGAGLVMAALGNTAANPTATDVEFYRSDRSGTNYKVLNGCCRETGYTDGQKLMAWSRETIRERTGRRGKSGKIPKVRNDDDDDNELFRGSPSDNRCEDRLPPFGNGAKPGDGHMEMASMLRTCETLCDCLDTCNGFEVHQTTPKKPYGPRGYSRSARALLLGGPFKGPRGRGAPPGVPQWLCEIHEGNPDQATRKGPSCHTAKCLIKQEQGSSGFGKIGFPLR